MTKCAGRVKRLTEIIETFIGLTEPYEAQKPFALEWLRRELF